MTTHSLMLMAYPRAQLQRLSNHGLEAVTVRETDHAKDMREFCETRMDSRLRSRRTEAAAQV